MTNSEKPNKPVPVVDENSQPFFDAAARSELMLQRCSDCHAFLWPYLEICTECLSEDIKWSASSGKGTVHSFVIMHRLFHPGFQDDVPYNLIVVELEEGPRVTSILREIANDDIQVGMQVHAQWHDTSGGPLLHFEPI